MIAQYNLTKDIIDLNDPKASKEIISGDFEKKIICYSCADASIGKNDDIYIEFTRNNDGTTNCCCNLIVYDNNRLFIKQPNY